MHDALSAYDLVHDEIHQRRESGYDVDAVATAFASTDPGDTAALEGLLDRLDAAERSAPWPYDEPDDLQEIVATLPAETETGPGPGAPADVEDRVHGGWLGRIAGCNLGKPVERGDHWTRAHLEDYLRRADAYPIDDYIPALDPMPEGFELRPNWVDTTRGRVHGSARDDDIDYAILGLHVLETYGRDYSSADVAHEWLSLLPFLMTYTAERVAIRNLVHGLTPGRATASYRNPYREWIGAQIRADAFGWVNPGRPRAAALLAYEDAALSHVGNGVYGEMWSAALVAASFTAASARDAVVESLQHVPPDSRLSEAVHDVLDRHASGATWEATTLELEKAYGHYSWVHAINNAAAVAAGILWGDGDFTRTIGLTVQAGLDTDSNGATAGSVAGVLTGARALPSHWVDPLQNSLRSAVVGFDRSAIDDLASRTVALLPTT